MKSSFQSLSAVSRSTFKAQSSNPRNRKPLKPGYQGNSGVVQGVFTYNGKLIRQLVPEIVSIFKGSTGFLGTLNDYRAKHHEQGESFDLMQWFYAEIQRRGWNDHDIEKKGDLGISLSQFIVSAVDGDYDAKEQQQELPSHSLRHPSEPLQPKKIKIGFVLEREADREDAELLEAAFTQIRTFRKQVKRSFQIHTLSRLKHIPKEERPRILFDDYNDHLAFFDNQLILLESTVPFRTSALVLLKHQERNGLIPVVNREGKMVATITCGGATFSPHPGVDEHTRTMFRKHGKPDKEYVADNRGIPTSRYIYVEKNYYQFMQFLTTLTMEGRYQLFQKAVGLKPDLFNPGSGFAAKQVVSGPVPGKLNLSQLAVMHQMMGNGPQQRGISLTSTCKIGAIFSNEGDPFREIDGVRIKVDLARVPKDVILLNHYASGGIVDDLETVHREVRGGKQKSNYNYMGSVQKNREIFLEHLRVEWIASIEFHESGRTVCLGGRPDEPTLQEMRRIFGHDAYVKGIKAALAGEKLGPLERSKLSRDFLRGYDSGKLYLDGYSAGRKMRKDKQAEDPFGKLATQFVRNEKDAKAAKGKRNPDIYWLGWGHGYMKKEYDPLAEIQSRESPVMSGRAMSSLSSSFSIGSSLNDNNNNNNNNSFVMSHSGPSSSSSSSSFLSPPRADVSTPDPSAFLAPDQSSNIWEESAIGKLFKGKDGRTYKLIAHSSITGQFHFELQK